DTTVRSPQRQFLGTFRHPTPEDLEARAEAVADADAKGLVGLWEWCQVAESADPGSLPPEMWPGYSQEHDFAIETAYRAGEVKVEIAVGIRSYEILFEGDLPAGRQ
ncbi:unnamed protein product, partial [Polarella glacialis]